MNAILEAAVDGILTIDEQGRIESVNGAAIQMFGYAREELLGRNVKVLMPSPYRDKHDGYLARYVRTGENKILGTAREVEGRRKDGSVFPLHLSVGEAVLSGRRVFTGIVRDLRDQREVEAAVRRNFARTQAIIEAAVDAIATIDEFGRVESVNPALERLFGYTRAELIGTNVKRLMPEPYASAHDGYLAAYRATRERTIIGAGRQVEGRRKDGTVFPMYLSVSEVQIAGERLFAGNMHDLTPQKRLEEQLLQSQKMEAIGVLAGGVAHDFNNLLTSILGSLDVSRLEVPEDTRLDRSLTRIRLAAERGEALTKQLLAFSRKQATRPERIDLGEAVSAARELFGRLLTEDIAIEVSLHPEPALICVDPGQLDQVIINLVVNARDAMPEGGRLTLTTGIQPVDAQEAALLGVLPGSYVTLAIRDSGTGIPDPVRHQIFEPFFTTKEPGKGTGLGLSTVLGIVREHDGAIDVESAPGRGTTFTLYFPRESGDRTPQDREIERSSSDSMAGRLVLVVEDDGLMRELLAELLELEGLRVLIAEDPETAIDVARGSGVELVLTDVVMPQMTGFELVRRLREEGGRFRVVYMSGYTNQMVSERGELTSEVGFLRKPFRRDELRRKLLEAFSRPSE